MNRWIARLNAPFPFYLNDDRKNFLLNVGISVFVVFFLHVYKPYNAHAELTVGQEFMFAGVTLVVLSFNIIVLPRIFPSFFDQWTVGKYILMTSMHIVLIGIASTLIDIYYICPYRTIWENIVGAHKQVIMTGAIPVAILFLFLKNTMLQQNLQEALQANRELEKIRNLKKEIPVKTVANNNHALTIHSDTSETLNLHLPDLLFVEADDNYSTVYWKNSDGIQKKLLRANLKNIENQINNSFAIRCHRSYLVNVNAISNITGNTNGYKLQILDTDFFVPVSRPKGKAVIEKIQQLKNVMELA